MAVRRVLICSTAYLPLIGGAEIAVKEVTDRLTDYQFDLITARFRRNLPREETIGRVKVYRVGLGYSFDKFLLPWWGLIIARRLRREQHYLLIWSIMASYGGILGALIKRWLAAGTMPLVLTLQEGDEESYLQRYALGYQWLYRLLIRPWYHSCFTAADGITAISNYLVGRAAREVNRTIPLKLIPNAVNTILFRRRADAKAVATLRRLIGKRLGDIIIISASRLVAKNGLSDLIGALQYLPLNYKLLLLGEGPLRADLERQAAPYGLGQRVFFFGQIDQTALPIYFAVAEVFVRPSLSEGFGNVFIEAMAASLPTIGTPVGGITDFLINEETGWLAPPGNARELARIIRQVTDPNYRPTVNRIVTTAFGRVMDHYDWEKIVPLYRQFFKLITHHDQQKN